MDYMGLQSDSCGRSAVGSGQYPVMAMDEAWEEEMMEDEMSELQM